MFTGIIESLGEVLEISTQGTNSTCWIRSSLSSELKVDQSLSHNGVCLTIEEISSSSHRVTAIEETLRKTNLGSWKAGTLVNLERCLAMNGRLDGHIVQGHVDTVATCVNVKELDGSWEYRFRFPASFSSLIIEKGSIGLNGISLTLFDIARDEFSVAIIPYTFGHTSMREIIAGAAVNLEFDMIGKYVARLAASRIPA